MFFIALAFINILLINDFGLICSAFSIYEVASSFVLSRNISTAMWFDKGAHRCEDGHIEAAGPTLEGIKVLLKIH